MSSLKGDNVPTARLCHIVKWDDFDGYGFNLHAEKGKNGQFIGKVDDGSPSQAAGLQQGDRIVEVNEINIANETHKQVVERIKAFANETKLLVVDQEADEYFRANNIVIKGTMANVKVIKTPEKNPNCVEQEEELNDSNASIDENVQKSNDASQHSESSTVSAGATRTSTRSENESECEEPGRENGNGIRDDATSTTTSTATMGHVHGTENGSVGGNEPRQGLNLKMSAKELRAQLAARKKYDPKKESIGFKDKFDIVQKL
ncbi:Na(+)/H(+) exchange regulatory cofactor NHE-RF3 [Ptiloglossa arizonensis]|uniref:Na(+)/H(+) exchange regulatory cofactor NHE-RF3 n=1 Tax=Ptiloglossa arizonensis TaxID=3350558 RepID=UPI003FA08B2C